MDWRFVYARVRWLLWALPLLWVFPVLEQWDYRPRTPGKWVDADAYYRAAENVRAGGDMYDPLPPPGPNYFTGDAHYLNPPPLAAVLAVLPVDRDATYNLMVALASLGALMLAWGVGRLAGWDWRIVAGLLYAWPYGLVLVGNVQPLVNGIVALSLTMAPPLAAFLLASGVAIKVQPFWALGIVLVRTRAWGGALAAVLLWGGLAAAELGVVGLLEECGTWLAHVAPTLAQGQMETGNFAQTNISPAFAPLYLLAPWPHGVELPAWARAYLAAVQLGAPALTIYLTRRFPWNVQAGWVLVAATLSAPILRAGYLPILLLAPALWWRGCSDPGRQPELDEQLADPLPRDAELARDG